MGLTVKFAQSGPKAQVIFNIKGHLKGRALGHISSLQTHKLYTDPQRLRTHHLPHSPARHIHSTHTHRAEPATARAQPLNARIWLVLWGQRPDGGRGGLGLGSHGSRTAAVGPHPQSQAKPHP